jgi:glycosyltransferase involved in cell wall biosynthesis
MAAHNSAAFIQGALASLSSQTERDWELLVTDDGSTDDTAAILEAAARGDRRIRLFRHETVKGPGAARNTALREACGEWVTILDSDDAFAPQRLERMVETAEERQLDFLADNLTLIDFETRRPLGQAFPAEWMSSEQLIDLHWVLQRNWPSHMDPLPFGVVQPLMRRAFLEKANLRYDEAIHVGEDLLLYGQALLAGARFGLMSDALYIYNIRQTSLSRSRESWLPGFIDLSKVNEIFRVEVGNSDRSLQRTLRLKSYAHQYDIFSFSLKEGKLLSALNSAMKMPAGYIVQRMSGSAIRRLRSGWVRLFPRKCAGRQVPPHPLP